MKIAIVGATGAVGSRLTAEATNRGHRVTALARSRNREKSLPPQVPLCIVEADTTDAMVEVFHGHDVVLVATRPRSGQESGITNTTRSMLDAAASAGVRIVFVGGSAPLRTPDDPTRRVLDDPRYVQAAWRTIARASADQLAACEDHTANWTYLSPPALLQPGTRTGSYHRGTDQLLIDEHGTSSISMEDLAVAVLDEAETPHAARHFTIRN